MSPEQLNPPQDPLRPRFLPWLVLIGMLIVPAARAAEVEGHPENRPTISIEQARARIGQLESATDLGEGQRAKLLEAYRQIVTRLETAATNAAKLDAFRKAIETAPQESKRLQEQLSQLATAGSESAVGALPEKMEAGQAQQLLTQEQAGLASLRSRLTELQKRITEEQARPAAARTQLADATTTLEQIETELAAPPPSPDAPELDRAQRGLLEARQRARSSEIQMLEQELVSNSVRLEALSASRDITARQISLAEARVRALEKKVSELRQAEAEQAREAAAVLQDATVGKHQLIRDAADAIAAITHEAESLGPKMDHVRGLRANMEEQLAQTQSDLEEAKRTVHLGLTDSLGTMLLEQRRNLPDVREFRRLATDRTKRISEARLRLFRIDRQLRQLSDVAKVAEQQIEASGGDGLTEADRAALRRDLENMLDTERDQLSRLGSGYRAYLEELRQLESAELDLLKAAGELAAILDERLLWIRSSLPLSGETLRGLMADLRWLFSAEGWKEVLATLRADFASAWPLHAAFGLALLLLVSSRTRLLAHYDRLADRVLKIRQDRMAWTLQAMGIHFLRIAPAPALMGFIAWRLMATPSPSEFAKAMGYGLFIAAATLLVLLFLSALSRHSGVAETHFQWSVHNNELAHWHLAWFMGIAVPCVFIIAITQWQADPLYRHSLGRFGFIALMLATTVLARLLLNQRRGIAIRWARGHESGFLARSRPLWLPLGMLVPLALAGLAASGYYYTASQLESRLRQTVLLLLGVVILYGLLHRWLVISQRRLRLKVALEKREAQAKSREAGEEDGTVESVLDMLEEIDVSEIREQTQDLLRMSVGLTLIVGLWFVWAGVMPALNILDSVQLWDQKVVVDGQEALQPVTLSNLGLSMFILLITVAAARNMPGFLEIALLQRLPLDPGTRYATRTLTLYAIVSVGVVLVFDSLGVSWSSVQWLVAALTVGLGFGLQEIFANFVSGLIILLERPIRVGDTVTVGEVSGVVTRIRMRAATITDWNRKELVVPNKNFITDKLINWSLSDPILRMDFNVGIAYGSDTTLAHKVMLQVCKDHPMVLDQPEPTVFFTGFGDNSLDFQVRVFVSEPTNTARTRIVHDLHMAIDQACRKHDISIAFPQRDLHLKSAEAVIRVEQVNRRENREESKVARSVQPESDRDDEPAVKASGRSGSAVP